MFPTFTTLRVGLGLSMLLLFTPLAAADYFWIGGSGNWSDISHWATTSGGTFTHSQAPGADDDVFFDANSFTGPGQTVTLNTDIIFCRNMTWVGVAGNPTLIGPASVSINVFGSWTLSPDMIYEFSGRTIFGGDGDNTINYADYPAGSTVDFAGTGSWTLENVLSCDSTLTLTEGTLNTNGETVNCGYLRSEGTANRTLRLGNSELNVWQADFLPFPQAAEDLRHHAVRLEATNLNLEAGTSNIILRGNRVSMLLEGPGDLLFNRVLLLAPMGRSRIIPWTRDNGFGSAPTVRYTELDLRHRTLLGGSPTIDHLILAGGQRYTFASGETFTLGELTANGDCTANIGLTAEFPASPTNLVSANDLTANFVSLRSLTAGGAGSFTANNAVDLGGNTGWTINEKVTEDFFWIGGTGLWSDPAHWSATSGGASNGCVPSVTDNVFFDANSFTGAGQTVTINVENAACRNMNWTGATGTPNFSGPVDHRMRVAGSLTFIEAMNHDFAGDYVFAAREGMHLITSARQRFNRDVTFDGDGAWSLADSFYVFESLQLLAGTLRTADQPVSAQFLRSQSFQSRGLFLGNSYVRLTSRNENFFYSEMVLESSNLVFDAGTSIIEIGGGFFGSTFLSGEDPLAFNVVIYASTLGTWNHNLFGNGAPLPPTIDSLIYRNSGEMSGDNDINYLEFRAGRTYEFLRNSTQRVVEMVANGSCDEGQTILQSTRADEPAFLELAGAPAYEYLLVRNMHVTDGAPVVVTNATDGGGNMGWDLSGEASRQLFWVGGQGDWFDRAHWSATSGGPGGECIPTAADDVFFDENSTAGSDMFVQNFSDRSATCRDLNWAAGIPNSIFFQPGRVRLYGDLNNAFADLQYGASPTYFYGSEADHEITTNGARLNQLIFVQPGTYTIADDLTAGELWVETGNLVFANQRSDLFRLLTLSSITDKTLDLGSTHMTLNAPTFSFTEAASFRSNANLTILPGTSLLELTDPTARLRLDDPVTLNNVLFSDPTGNAEIRSFNSFADDLTANGITFNGNGRISLGLATDTLICSPGKSYVFATGETQQINEYWQIIGNNCTPISLTSSVPGQAATVDMPASGEILADFIQMQDITGVGGANFFAGSRSTNINNSNVNWTFETAPEFQEVGFLGQDRALCAGEDLTLDAYNFSPGETYRWQDGSTDSTFVTNQSGIYSVEVTFQTSCVIRDTVEILDAQAFTVDLPDDPVICFGDTLIFDVDAGINSADYRWQDDSEESSLQAFTSGEYFAVVDLGGCIFTDTTELTVTPLPTVDLGADRIACAGDDFTLTVDVMAETFRWQDGSTDPSFTDDQPGTYWVEASNGNCPVRDSVAVTYIDPGTVNLGPDTTACALDELVLDAGITGVEYRWQDGSEARTFTPVANGEYFVEIGVSGLTTADTITVTFVTPQEPPLQDEYEACLGDTVRLARTEPGATFSWSNGQTGPEFSTRETGDYQLTTILGPCTIADDFRVNLLVPPVVDLGADITECSGIPVTLTIPLVGTWQDGTESASFTVTEAGQYRVEAFNGPCPAADSVLVEYLALPEFSLGEDQTGCVGDVLTVRAPSNLGFIFWDDGADATERTFTEPGLRWVEIEDDNGCLGRDSVELFFNDYPTLSLGPDTTSCDDRPFALTAASSGGSLRWPDGSTGMTFALDPAGGRSVTVAQLTENGCTTLDTVVVDFEECLDFRAYLPTAFSPNFDGVNDDFGFYTDARIEILDYQITIWNRWGAELFTSTDPAAQWDGTVDGQDLPAGVYLYSIEVTARDDRGVRSESISGDVTLVR
ncbi:MAG: gliding motility-associated C-terminal domain-containing protein [Bacteroidota bacterium]